MDMLERLWNSTTDLHARFETGDAPVGAQMRVVFEEVYEFTAAIHTIDGELDTAIEEGVDVMVTVLSSLMSVGASLSDIAEAFERVASKLDAKLPGVTHYVNEQTGKITRIGR